MNDEAVIVCRLRAARKDQGMSQREAARRAGLSSGGFNHIERGMVSPTFTNLLRWADVLGYDIRLVRRLDAVRNGE